MDVEADEPKDGLHLGPEVKVVRYLYTGDIAVHRLPAALAVEMVLTDSWNGDDVRRSRIVWGDVNSRDWDMSP